MKIRYGWKTRRFPAKRGTGAEPAYINIKNIGFYL